ncbi:MAG: hypothetical protein ABL999_02305 [Pyrinomonadaceae bacterium]
MNNLRIRYFFLLSAICLFAGGGYGQSVVVTAKKVTYTRPKPITDFRRAFTVIYPKIKAATPALSKKIEAAISYEKNFEMSIKDELNEIQWLENAAYDVGYNANGILSLSLTIEGSGAYPSDSTKYVVVDIKKGTKVKPADAFTDLSGLLAMVSKAKDKEVAEAIAEIKKDPDNQDADIEMMFKDSEQYKKVTLDEFEIDENGIVFHHDYGFAHVAQALQPEGDFFFSWAELKPFIKPSGLLGRIAR